MLPDEAELASTGRPGMRRRRPPLGCRISPRSKTKGDVGALAEVSPDRPRAFNMFKALFVVSPSRSTSMQFLSQLVPDRDVDLVRSTPDLDVLGSFAVRFMEAMVWGGEAINRLSLAHREVDSSHRSMDEVIGHLTELRKQLEELHVQGDEEKKVLEAENRALETELEDTKARADGEIRSLISDDRLKGEAEDAWNLGKANGYSKEEHPASFLDVVQALKNIPEEGEVAGEDAPRADASTPHPPRTPRLLLVLNFHALVKFDEVMKF
ncbi:chromatin modification-related protein eaf-1-like [Dorcoceras hygrometricum]|uniref:Chromatin modification-related protein eaf-1-like n=1 Tax=Dorcoceras hygrometricum TaxID=472368 RepID=A0A2Z7D9H0_9LAMI|nr:chromatin modification-related protein eaf-1-like [Dorcoceras hygrometricum]